MEFTVFSLKGGLFCGKKRSITRTEAMTGYSTPREKGTCIITCLKIIPAKLQLGFANKSEYENSRNSTCITKITETFCLDCLIVERMAYDASLDARVSLSRVRALVEEGRLTRKVPSLHPVQGGRSSKTVATARL